MESVRSGENVDIGRYSRQMLVPQVGMSGQTKLAASSVLVIGAGGIGSTVLLYLVGSGVAGLYTRFGWVMDEASWWVLPNCCEVVAGCLTGCCAVEGSILLLFSPI